MQVPAERRHQDTTGTLTWSPAPGTKSRIRRPGRPRGGAARGHQRQAVRANGRRLLRGGLRGVALPPSLDTPTSPRPHPFRNGSAVSPRPWVWPRWPQAQGEFGGDRPLARPQVSDAHRRRPHARATCYWDRRGRGEQDPSRATHVQCSLFKVLFPGTDMYHQGES